MKNTFHTTTELPKTGSCILHTTVQTKRQIKQQVNSLCQVTTKGCTKFEFWGKKKKKETEKENSTKLL